MKKLPQTVFVFWEGDGDEMYLRASVDEADVLDKPGQSQRVGIYELKEQADVRSTVATWRLGLPKRKQTRKA